MTKLQFYEGQATSMKMLVLAIAFLVALGKTGLIFLVQPILF